MPENFQWSPGKPLPSIEEHSLRKLDVLRKYLDVYFDTVAVLPQMDQLNITLIDGFSGGGAYRKDAQRHLGSPLVLLRAVDEARTRLNDRREKHLEINARFIFVDDNSNHVGSLEEQIRKEGFGEEIGRSITLITGEFATELPAIIDSIKQSQRMGRSIFVLDQFGYAGVPMSAVQKIFNELERPEVLLTFAIDAFLNYLQENSAHLETYRQFGVDDAFIAEWEANKLDEKFGRMVSQRALMTKIERLSGAEFFTPFMLWSQTDNRWMMIAHLSRHQAARDKMLGVHWNSQNSFRHFGRGSLFNLGFDTRVLETSSALFNFAEEDQKTLRRELVNELPNEIFDRMRGEEMSVLCLLENIGNRTAATNQHVFDVLELLVGHRELEVISKSGGLKRPSSRIHLTDRLIRPAQKQLFGLV